MAAPNPPPDDNVLLQAARLAAENAYAPYSTFRVGAAIRTGGRIYTGCNVENASYGLAMCAERNAIFNAVANGETQIDALALACIDAAPHAVAGSLMPCGACLQVMAEFASPDMPVLIDRAGTRLLADLLPYPFKINEGQGRCP